MTDTKDTRETKQPSKRASKGVVLLDVQNRTGADHDFAQTGVCTYAAPGAGILALHPGLNPLDASTWEVYRMHPPIAAMLTDGRIKVIDSLESMPRAALRDLGQRSGNGDGLALLHKLEAARPRSAGRRDRFDAEHVEYLERKLGAAARRRPVNLDSIKVPAAKAS